jgi:hypothetical protein
MSGYRTTMAIREPNALGVRVPAEICLQNDAQYTDQVFVEATTRIQDLLNSPGAFLPLID